MIYIQVYYDISMLTALEKIANVDCSLLHESRVFIVGITSFSHYLNAARWNVAPRHFDCTQGKLPCRADYLAVELVVRVLNSFLTYLYINVNVTLIM